MTGLPEREAESSSQSAGSADEIAVAAKPEQRADQSRVSLLSSLLASTLSVFESASGPSSSGEKKEAEPGNYVWSSVKRVVYSGSMWRILGAARPGALSSDSDVWLLGICYQVSQQVPGNSSSSGLSDFLHDFSSRIWITYRRGFDAIDDSKFTSDASWGCMIRSSQMLVAQALLFHRKGRSWRKPVEKPYDSEYIEILHLFGDSEARPFSIHNLLLAGKSYGLSAGSWLGPYAMCRTWETLVRTDREQPDIVKGKASLPMVVYIVSGDEDGERGGAPVVCIDVAAKLCSDFTKGQLTWAPMLLLVPLVLGLDKINPRYIPLLQETFKFPQSLGILGGRPGASTYIVGIQDDKALYLDPHEVQPVVDIKRDDLAADNSSYHCSNVRYLQLDSIDPSLAIGFYCRDKVDFEDFCSLSSKLGDSSNGAPLFSVAQSLQHTKSNLHQEDDNGVADSFKDESCDSDAFAQEDDWQIL